MRQEPKQKSPQITLTDESLRPILERKLEEYRLRNSAGRYKDPNADMDAVLKAEVLERVLKSPVDAWALSREMAQKYGNAYSPEVFANACAVIDEYCKTGGKGIEGGTGLKK